MGLPTHELLEPVRLVVNQAGGVRLSDSLSRLARAKRPLSARKRKRTYPPPASCLCKVVESSALLGSINSTHGLQLIRTRNGFAHTIVEHRQGGGSQGRTDAAQTITFRFHCLHVVGVNARGDVGPGNRDRQHGIGKQNPIEGRRKNEAQRT